MIILLIVVLLLHPYQMDSPIKQLEVKSVIGLITHVLKGMELSLQTSNRVEILVTLDRKTIICFCFTYRSFELALDCKKS